MNTKGLVMSRGIDHLVLCVHDLKKARAFYETLGFTMTPVARHPFGTSNTLAQMDGCFLEVLAVSEPGAIPEADADNFSFAAFNRDFLKTREGMSMLVLDSTDAAADRKAFLDKGLHVYAPFDFQRQAKLPDGSEATVGFSLTFLSHPKLRDLAFFTCMQWRPDLFWKPDYQRHANGALSIEEVFIIAPDPVDAATFLTAFADSPETKTGEGVIKVQTARGRLGIYTPDAFDDKFPSAFPAHTQSMPRFAGFSVRSNDPAIIVRLWRQADLKVYETEGTPWLHPDEGMGCVIAAASSIAVIT
ncbi:MAG: VOC family protein [Rhodospirillales bacterium]